MKRPLSMLSLLALLLASAALCIALAANKHAERAARYERTEFQTRVNEFAVAFNTWCNFRNQIEAGQVVDFKHTKEAELWTKFMQAVRRLETALGTPSLSSLP